MVPISKRERVISAIERDCKCGGLGCVDCRSKIARILLYSNAGIPVEYWNRAWKQFSGDKNFKESIKSLLLRVDDIYDSGKSFAFVGNLGVGKSYAACSILKLALTKDFSCKYETMSDVINTILSSDNNSEYLRELMEVDFLAIDELDARWIAASEKAEQTFGSIMEHVLRTRFQNKMPTILCSNTIELDTVFSEAFARTFESLRNQYINVLYVSGKDFRKDGKSS